MKIRCYLIFGLSLCAMAMGADSPGWLRYPAIAPNGHSIVFTYKGDLYRVPVSGGQANQLTTHDAQDFMPVWSPDGKQIAFASDRHGSLDVFVMDAAGGPARRLTWHSAAEIPTAFTSDGRNVCFTAARGGMQHSRVFPNDELPLLYRVPVAGGRVSLVQAIPTEAATFSPDGRWMVYHDKKGVGNPWRKHDTSPITRDVWVLDTKTGQQRRLTTCAGEDRNPVVSPDGREVTYLSEEEGSFNVRRMPIAGGPSTPLTHFKDHPVRSLSQAKDGTLCFGYDGRIFTLKPGGRPVPVEIDLQTDRGIDQILNVPIAGGIKEFAVAPQGRDLAMVVRGQVLVAPLDGGPAVRVTTHPGQHRDVSFSPNGKLLVYASERSGRWSILASRLGRPEDRHFHAATRFQETVLVDGAKALFQPSLSPDGKELAFIEDRVHLKVLNLETRKVRELVGPARLHSRNDGDQHFRWSPDGRWILIQMMMPGKSQPQVGLVRADGTGEVVDLTRSGYDCQNPTWALGGRMVVFASDRDGMRAHAATGGRQMDVYGLYLTQDAWDQSRWSKAERALAKEAGEARSAEVVLDLTRRPERIVRLTAFSSQMGEALLSADGETLYHLARFERGLNLWSTQVRTRESRLLTTLDAQKATLLWDRDQRTIFGMVDGGICRIDPASGKRDPVTISGDLAVGIAAERDEMFEHVCRRIEETFYDPRHHGVDWARIKAAYRSKVRHVGTAFEFRELMDELLGELNVSHCGLFARGRAPQGEVTAALGMVEDADYAGPGLRVAEVLPGGPLDRAGLGIEAGTILETLDGEALGQDRDAAAAFNRKAGKRVLVGFRNGDQRGEAVVVPGTPAEEVNLLYERWVQRNRAEVEQRSGGRLAYVHLRSSFDRSFRAMVDEVLGHGPDLKGVVVDDRYNPGGSLTSDLMAFLTGRAVMVSMAHGRSVGQEAGNRWTGPSLLLVNEGAYSDGACLAATYQREGIGKLVGMPIAGTCILSISELLQDDATIFTAPTVGVLDPAGKVMEGTAVQPDMTVRNEPRALAQGRDLQLEAAVQLLLQPATPARR